MPAEEGNKEPIIMVNMRGEKHRGKKRKHEVISGGGPFFLLPEGTGKTAAEIRG